MKVKRNLSGIYFRSKREEKWDNVCFEDLDEIEQDKIINAESHDWAKRMIKILADTLNEIGDNLDLEKQ